MMRANWAYGFFAAQLAAWLENPSLQFVWFITCNFFFISLSYILLPFVEYLLSLLILNVLVCFSSPYFLASWILAAFECHSELILEKEKKKKNIRRQNFRSYI